MYTRSRIVVRCAHAARCVGVARGQPSRAAQHFVVLPACVSMGNGARCGGWQPSGVPHHHCLSPTSQLAERSRAPAPYLEGSLHC